MIRQASSQGRRHGVTKIARRGLAEKVFVCAWPLGNQADADRPGPPALTGPGLLEGELRGHGGGGGTRLLR